MFGGFTSEDVDRIQQQTRAKQDSDNKLQHSNLKRSTIGSNKVKPKAVGTKPKQIVEDDSGIFLSPKVTSPRKEKTVTLMVTESSYEMVSKDNNQTTETPKNVETLESEDKDIGKDNESQQNKLESFEQRRRQIEEQNKRRREALNIAIKDRKQRTDEETKKIKHVQRELQQLDSTLSADVAILRERIETASLEFSNAQKRYNRAEQEYVAAKLELFKRLELKDQLAEHLCYVIEASELRKAERLSELMNQLNLNEETEDTNSNRTSTTSTTIAAPTTTSMNTATTSTASNKETSNTTPTSTQSNTLNNTTTTTIEAADRE